MAAAVLHAAGRSFALATTHEEGGPRVDVQASQNCPTQIIPLLQLEPSFLGQTFGMKFRARLFWGAFANRVSELTE